LYKNRAKILEDIIYDIFIKILENKEVFEI